MTVTPDSSIELGAGPILTAVAHYAQRSPEATAVSASDGRLSFAELADHVQRFARVLRAEGAGPAVPVALCLGRSKLTVPALLAVWTVGAAAVPVDDQHPADRLAFQLADANVPIILGDKVPAGVLPPGARVLAADQDAPEQRTLATGELDDSAYIIYTSGTTGRPKGVDVSYRAFGTFLSALRTLELSPGGMGFNGVSPAFDGWLWCTLLYLLHGQGVALLNVGKDGVLDLAASLATLAPRSVCLTPAMLAACADDMPEIDVLVVAGEHCPPGLIQRFEGRCHVLNVYGPTEVTIAATWADSTRGDDVTGIGRALPGYVTYVLDERRQPVERGTRGELYIGGAALATGYRNLPGLTAARFVPDPFAGDGARMYRTGDMVLEREDGQLVYFGRIDHQVKVRGFRVELTEIERVATTVSEIRSAAAFLTKSGDAVGLAVTIAPTADVPKRVEEVRAVCTEQLPDYMIPVVLDVVPSIPVNVNGKVDRQRLAESASTTGARQGGRAPVTEHETQVCAVWSEMLPSPVVDLDADFFAMGGHSLLAARAVAALRRVTGLRLSIGDMLGAPTAGALAKVLDDLKAAEGDGR